VALDVVSYGDLADCRLRVRDTFLADCVSRAGVGHLPPGVFAGGQYFTQPEQRGILGTAAALRVLSLESKTHPASREAAQALVRYVDQRRRIELDTSRTNPEERLLWRQKLRRDDANTIRQSELLLSLTFVPSALAACDHKRAELATRLLDGRASDGNGWGYALGAQAAGSLLPTCHAVRALAHNGNDVTAEVQHLRRQLEHRVKRRDPDLGTAYVDCFTALVLQEHDVLSTKESRAILDHLWSRLANHLGMSREANIDVLGGSSNDFVRVPWQLHLMALSAKDRPWRRFLSPRLQRLLGEVVRGVLQGPGFRYPDSGDNVSTRTYAYIHETISTILASRSGSASVDSNVAKILRAAELPGRPVRKVARTLAVIGAAGIIAFSIAMWLLGRAGGWKDLAPNFVAAMLIGVVGWVARPKSS
jgi:hypothetical protein